jgi:hypothetical protein
MKKQVTVEGDRCKFCGGPDAHYGRREDAAGPRGEYYAACETCARKPYPVPEQLKRAKGKAE